MEMNYPPAFDAHGEYLFVVPVVNLILGKAVNREFRVNRVTFIARDKLPRVRQRFGIRKRLSEFPETWHGFMSQTKGDNCNNVALVRQTGKPKEIWRECYRLVAEESALLSLSYLLYSKRKYGRAMGTRGQFAVGGRDYAFVGTDNNHLLLSSSAATHTFPMELDANWKSFHRKFFFFNLLKLLRGEASIDVSWRDDIRRAAVLGGRSISTLDIPTAFLWNMMALECLITQQGEKVKDALPERCEAFLGWVGFWKQQKFCERIREAYAARCRLVHQGDESCIDKKIVLFTDDIIFNIFHNILNNLKVFKSKNALIDFSNKVKAEHLLGVKPKVRPKNFLAIARRYRPGDFEAI
jgi:hypothetical protein